MTETEKIEKEMQEIKKKLEDKGIQAEIMKILDCGVILKPSKKQELKWFIKEREKSLKEDQRNLKEYKDVLKRMQKKK